MREEVRELFAATIGFVVRLVMAKLTGVCARITSL